MPISFVSRGILSERVWSKVKVDRPENCWEWTGTTNESGYGILHFRGADYRATRVIWMSIYGYIAEGLCILHKCDNRKCVNPSHLFLGTRQENTKDMLDKGRSAKGSHHSQAKLTENDVIEIRRLGLSNLNQKEIAQRYGVRPTLISRILNHKIWKHI